MDEFISATGFIIKSELSLMRSSSPSPTGLVADIDRFAVHDGPGIRTAVYLKGCPLRCPWCHSPETQRAQPELVFYAARCTACGLCLPACPEGALSLAEPRIAVDWARCTHCGECTKVCYPGALKLLGRWVTADELLAEIERDRPFFQASGGGVTLTGGEATAQPAFCRAVLAGCRARGIHTALETNGCAPWAVYQDLAGLVDLFLYDVKLVDDDRHRALTGASNRLALENLARLAGLGAEIVARVPCIPGLNDSPEDISAAAALVSRLGLKRIDLLPYNETAGAKYAWLGREYPLPGLKTQAPDQMEALAGLCRSSGLSAQIG